MSVYFQKPLKQHGPGPKGQSGVNLGGRIVFDYSNYPNPNIPVADPNQWFGSNKWGVVGAKRILTGRAIDIPSNQKGPGSWVVSISGRVIQASPLPAIEPSIGSPLVAVVQYGTGAVSKTFEVDAWRGMFAIPSTDFTVDVGWGRPGTNFTAVGGFIGVPNAVPTITEVKATVYRSLEVGDAIPTRSFWLNPDDAIGNLVLRLVPIPEQAISWCVSTPSALASTETPFNARALSIQQDLTPVVADAVSSDILTVMARGRCFRELPNWSRSLSVRFDPAAMVTVSNYSLLEFRLGF